MFTATGDTPFLVLFWVGGPECLHKILSFSFKSQLSHICSNIYSGLYNWLMQMILLHSFWICLCRCVNPHEREDFCWSFHSSCILWTYLCWNIPQTFLCLFRTDTSTICSMHERVRVCLWCVKSLTLVGRLQCNSQVHRFSHSILSIQRTRAVDGYWSMRMRSQSLKKRKIVSLCQKTNAPL